MKRFKQKFCQKLTVKGFKATYKCLVGELLSCDNAEIAEDVCSIVKSKLF